MASSRHDCPLRPMHQQLQTDESRTPPSRAAAYGGDLPEGYSEMSCRHVGTGFVTNQDPDQPLDMKRAHMSTTTCEREKCMESSIRAVAAFTNETATYYSYAERRAARAAKERSEADRRAAAAAVGA